MVRYYGAYSNRARQLYRTGGGEAAPLEPERGTEQDPASWNQARRRSWARLLRRIYEVDALVCPRCGDDLEIVAVITDPVVVDRILAHRARKHLRGLFEARAPPAA